LLAGIFDRTLRGFEALLSSFPRGLQLLRNAGHDTGSVLKSIQKTVQGYRAWKIFQMIIKPIYIYIYIYIRLHRSILHFSILVKYFLPIVFYFVYIHLSSQGVRTHVHACIFQDVYFKNKIEFHVICYIYSHVVGIFCYCLPSHYVSYTYKMSRMFKFMIPCLNFLSRKMIR